jgi:hypothetical protein
MVNSTIKIEGQFRFDVYSGQQLVRSSDYQDNFITNSGVVYPYYYAFADCFRYLSLGTGTGVNSTGVVGFSATTGLHSGVKEFMYLGSKYYSTGVFGAGGCGNQAYGNKISLFRQWGLPDATGGVFQEAHAFKEMMVTPGSPPVTGWIPTGVDNSNPNPPYYYIEWGTSTGYYSEDQMFSSTGVDPYWPALSLAGPDYPDLSGDYSKLAKYYDKLTGLSESAIENGGSEGGRTRPPMRQALAAFSRIVTDMDVNSGETLLVTYKLNLVFATGISDKPTYTNSSPDPNWSKTKFIGNLTQPGVKLINDGTLGNSSSVYFPYSYYGYRQRQQHSDFDDYSSTNIDFENSYGESFVPVLGIPLEPSAIYSVGGNFKVYVSEDNRQFLVSPSGGNCENTGLYKPWNTTGLSLPQNSGLLPFTLTVTGNAIDDSTSSNYTDYWRRHPTFIRQYFYNNPGYGNSRAFPDTGHVTATEDTSFSPAIYESPGLPVPRFSWNGRTGQILTPYSFAGFTDVVCKSLVFCYVDAQKIVDNFAYGSYYHSTIEVPFYDCLISGHSGQNVFLPAIKTGSQNNTTPTTISGADLTGYNFLSIDAGSKFPIISTTLTWVAECPPGVSGCP